MEEILKWPHVSTPGTFWLGHNALCTPSLPIVAFMRTQLAKVMMKTGEKCPQGNIRRKEITLQVAKWKIELFQVNKDRIFKWQQIR